MVRVPFACEHCDAACGLIATVDPTEGRVRSVEGDPEHPASRGRICPAGPATFSQLAGEARVLQPLRRVGARGEGRWEPLEWDAALDLLAARLRETIEAERLDEILVQLGAAEADPFTAAMISAWGLDALSTDPTRAAPGGGLGLQLWMGSDRLHADWSQAKTILVVGGGRDGSPLHPDPRRLLEAKRAGARLIVVEPVRGALGALADLWLPARPGTEAVLLLSIAHHLIVSGGTNRDFMRRWWNWMDYMEARFPGVTLSFPRFELALSRLYAHYGFEFAARECGLPQEDLERAAAWVRGAGTALASWSGATATEGDLGGWQVSRALFLLNALLGAIGSPGGVSPGAWLRFLPAFPWPPPAPDLWNRLAWPPEFPLAGGPSAPLLPWQLRAGRGRLSVLVSDRYDPVRTSPDGFAWLDALEDEEKIGFHAALTPCWTQTARRADLVLPVGWAPERHGLCSTETGPGRWLGLRQPVIGQARETLGVPYEDARRANPGQVWDELELWIALAWRLDPEGRWGIREAFESRQFPGERLRLDELLSVALERGAPELREAASLEGASALQLLRRRGAFQVEGPPGAVHERVLRPQDLHGLGETREGRVYALRVRQEHPEGAELGCQPDPDPRGRAAVGLRLEGEIRRGFSTPSGKLEFYSPTMADWGWPEHALPSYVRSHVHQDLLQHDELVWVPIFEAPSPEDASWSAELAHLNPLWLNPRDAARLGLRPGDPTRVETEIGHFVTRAWVTESVRPGVVACDPTRARWRTGGPDEPAAALAPRASLQREGDRRSLAREEPTHPGAPGGPAARAWWSEGGFPALLAMPVHPDPVTGAHCWNQVVRVRPAQPKDLPGDASADRARADRVVELWLSRARPARESSPDRTRRPRWLVRVPKPMGDAWKLADG